LRERRGIPSHAAASFARMKLSSAVDVSFLPGGTITARFERAAWKNAAGFLLNRHL